MEHRGVNYLSNFGYVAEGLFTDQKEIDNAPPRGCPGTGKTGRYHRL